MSETKHTPGPWTIHSTPLSGADGIYAPWPEGAPNRPRIATMANRSNADARLIAAAPDGLAFAERWLGILADPYCSDEAAMEPWVQEFAKEARSFIAKATE